MSNERDFDFDKIRGMTYNIKKGVRYMFLVSILSLDTEKIEKTVIHEQKVSSKSIGFVIDTALGIDENHTDFLIFVNHIEETTNKKLTLTFQYNNKYVFSDVKITANIDDVQITASIDYAVTKVLLKFYLAQIISDMFSSETQEDAIHAFSVIFTRLFVEEMCAKGAIVDEERLDYLAYCLTKNKGNGIYEFFLSNRSFNTPEV